MGIILSGILSSVSGKVAGVVGGKWKDKAYLRAYVKPANPKTAGQIAQRTKFYLAVALAKPLVGQVFNSYTDKFLKSMSGFNYWIKANIAYMLSPITWASLKITEGPLSSLASVVATYASPTVTIAFTKNLGNNGADTDKVFGAICDESTRIWYFAAAEVDRSTETIDVTCAAGLTATDLHCYIWPAQYISGVLSIIGNSVYDEAA